MEEMSIALLGGLDGESPANYQLADPDLLEFYQDTENRIYRLYGEVCESMLELARLIIEWNREDKDIPIDERKPIKIMIFSPGGDLNVFRTLRAVVQLSKTPVWGINMGEADSAAALLFLSCPFRIALPGAKLLLHYGSISLSMGGKDAVETLRSYEKELDEIVEVIQEASGLEEEFIKENLHNDWIIPISKQLEYNMTDHTVKDIDELF